MRISVTDTKVEALKHAPLFEDLSREELSELAKRTDDLDFHAGKLLCREGELGSEFYVIMTGEAEAARDGEKLAEFGPGDFFGEISLVEDVPRNATVTATTDVRCFVLTRGHFLNALEDLPEVERKVMRALARRLASVSNDPTH